MAEGVTLNLELKKYNQLRNFQLPMRRKKRKYRMAKHLSKSFHAENQIKAIFNIRRNI